MSAWVRILQRLRQGPASARSRRALTVAGLGLFGFITWRGFAELPPETSLNPWSLGVLALIGGPAITIATAGEYKSVAAICRVEPSWPDAMAIATVAAVANLLPIPGSTLVRATHLRRLGASKVQIARAISASGLAFIGVTGTFAAGATAAASSWLESSLFALLALLALPAAYFFVDPQDRLAYYLRLLRAEAIVVATVIGRLYVALSVIGQEPSVFAASLLGTASVGAAAVAIMPGGLGVREVLSGLLGSVAGISVATGIVAASIDRLTYYAGVALATGSLAVCGKLEPILATALRPALSSLDQSQESTPSGQ